jgi:hypothetical protein
MTENNNITDALTILASLGFPRAQQNERSALCLLALADVNQDKDWSCAENPLVGITPMIEFSRKYYGKDYAPNTRETFRRQTIHQFVLAGLALYNPDNPSRPVNSPRAVYQLSPEALELIRAFGSERWSGLLEAYLAQKNTLSAKYAKTRNQRLVPVVLASGKEIKISPGAHSELIKAIIEDFAPRFAPGGTLVYAGDAGDKWGYFDRPLLAELGVIVDSHGKMPDVVIYLRDRNWLLLIESVTSHGPVDGKRHAELDRLFAKCSAGLVYVTAFPDRSIMARHLGEIAWETEVWVRDAPSHLIHFNGSRFLGPHGATAKSDD